MRDLIKIIEGSDTADTFASFRGEDDRNYGVAYKNFCAMAADLKTRGFEEIGIGFHGFVFRSAAGVFKIFFNDGSYLRFLEFAHRHQDDLYMPRVSEVDRITPLVSVVHLEPLIHLEPTESTALLRALKMDRPFRREGLLKSWPGLCATMAALNAARGSCQWDFETHNFMKRADGHVVINDPFKAAD